MHALKFLHYVVEAGGRVAIPAVEAAEQDISSAEQAAQMALDWELEVTKQINSLMSLAIAEQDYIAQDFLRWFVTEQLEEVSSMDELLTVIRRVGAEGLMMVEEYLSRRPDPHAAGAEAGA